MFDCMYYYTKLLTTGSANINNVKHRPYRVNMWKGKTKAVSGIKISCRISVSIGPSGGC